MSRRFSVASVLLCACLWLVTAAAASSKDMVDETYVEMNKIVADNLLSAGQKIERLRGYFSKQEYWPGVLYRVYQVDPAEGDRIAAELFGKRDTSVKHKLQIGRFVLTRRDRPPSDAFVGAYAKFLVEAILEDKGAAFMRKREEGTETVVAEYAMIAGGFEGYSWEQFEKFKDKRLIPVLIRCLSAPDEVYGTNHDNMGGKPGEPTGRDVARQHIPIALARLGAVEAAEPLKKALLAHHDYWLRYNSAYALSYLLERAESKEIERAIGDLKDKDARLMFFPFGWGLIARGDPDGVPYMSFKYSSYFSMKDICAPKYMLEQRLHVLKGFKDKRTEEFFREALTYEPLRSVLLLDAGKVEASPWPPFNEPGGGKAAQAEAQLRTMEDDIVKTYRAMLEQIQENKLASLCPLIAEIARKTRSQGVREASERWLANVCQGDSGGKAE